MVFTTNSSDFAVRGFELRVSDYLVKPFSYEKFKDTLKYCERSMRSHARYIEVKESRTMIKIRLDDIIFTDYFNHYIPVSYTHLDVYKRQHINRVLSHHHVDPARRLRP